MRRINFSFLYFFILFFLAIPKTSLSHTIKNCNDPNGLKCWQCGNDCTATLYDGGKLVISGTGSVKPGFGSLVNNPNLPQDVTYIKIENGITSLEKNAFYGVGGIKKMELADSVESAGVNAFITGGAKYQLIVSENSSLKSISTYYSLVNNIGSVFCRGDNRKCRETLTTGSSQFQNIPITNEIRDSKGNLLEKCNSFGCETYDSNSNVSAKYDLYGNLIEEYTYDRGGNLRSIHRNGIEVFRRRSYTPAEATAVVKDNKNTFSIRYR